MVDSIQALGAIIGWYDGGDLRVI